MSPNKETPLMSESDAKVNILVVDDRPEKLLALEAVLEDLGQRVVRAYSGREALRHVLAEEFAVILLDVNMPDMDGFETARLIRQRKSSEHIPIIFITAFGDEMHVAQGYSLGAVDYILAPVVPDVLRSKVSVFVDLFRKTEQVRRQAESLRRRASQLQKLAGASVAISSEMSIDRMLQTVTDTARDVIGSHQAITLFIDPRPGQRACRVKACASYSPKYAEWKNQTLELDAIADTMVFRSYTATRLTERELHEHPDWEIVQHVRVPPIRGGMLAAPMTGRDGTRLGVIYLCDRGDGPFTPDDESIAVQLAQMASIAIENSLFAEEREANRIKDEFLSTLSHELRTPLNAILGWTQILQMEQPTGDLAHGLEIIERNARAQTKLIEDLLDVSRITSGKLRLSTSVVNAATVVHAAVDSVRPTAEAKKVAVSVSVPEQPCMLVADPDRLQQVVWNLLVNAVKFTPSGGSVSVEARRLAATLEIRVADSGQGIAREFLPYVFERFRQADSTATRSHGGLGIGLSIVRHIVALHGGTVRADSPGEGMGAIFTVTIPITEAANIPDQLPPQREGGANGDGMHVELAGLRVLVVDDSADALEVATLVLRRAGAEVRGAGSGAEARRALAEFAPQLLISDIAMPDEDGHELMRWVRGQEEFKDLPAIALTAYAREEDRRATAVTGFNAHVAKPVEPEALLGTVMQLVSAQELRSAVVSGVR